MSCPIIGIGPAPFSERIRSQAAPEVPADAPGWVFPVLLEMVAATIKSGRQSPDNSLSLKWRQISIRLYASVRTNATWTYDNCASNSLVEKILSKLYEYRWWLMKNDDYQWHCGSSEFPVIFRNLLLSLYFSDSSIKSYSNKICSPVIVTDNP